MHDILLVHCFQALQNALECKLDLFGRKFVFGLDFVIELSPFEQLHADVDGVLALVDLVEFHQIFVVELSHEFYFVYQ